MVPWQACLFIVLSYRYRFIVIVANIYRNSVGTVFLIVSFLNDNTETFGTISTTSVHILRFFDSIPAIFLSTFRAVLADYSFCSNHTIHIQTGVHSPMSSGVGNDTHQKTSQSGPTSFWCVCARGKQNPACDAFEIEKGNGLSLIHI